MSGRQDLTPAQRRIRFASRVGSKATVALSRLSGGRGIARMAPKDAPPVFLLTTTGRKTGKPRTVALSYLTDGDDEYVVGSNGGLPYEPAWVLNLRDTPEAVAQIGTERFHVLADLVEGDEAERLWERILAEYPIYNTPRETANREIPIFRLQRMHEGEDRT